MVEEVRFDGGRQGALPRDFRIAAAVHNIYAAGVRKQLIEWWHNVPPQEIVSSLEKPDGAVFDFYGRDATPHLWGGILNDMAVGERAYEIVREMKPDMVLVWTDEYAWHRGMVMAGNELGVPTVELCHGSFYAPRIGHHAAKKFAGWQLGTANYRDFHTVMECKGKVVETGSVEQDPYFGLDVMELRQTAREEYRIPQEAPVVTFLTDASFARGAWMDVGVAYRSFGEFMKAWKGFKGILNTAQLVVKVHPYEGTRASKYREFIEDDFGVHYDYTVVQEPLISTLGAADVVVGRPSSAMASALAMGIPCVVLAWEPWMPDSIWEGRGCMVAREPAQVISYLVRFFLKAGEAEKWLTETPVGAAYFGGDGNAARRAAAAIVKIGKGEMT